MPLVKAQCTNCGGNLEVDSSKEAAVCPHCGTPYIVEKAINQFITQNVQGGDPEYIRLKGMADCLLNGGDYDNAYKHYSEIFNKYRNVDSENIMMMVRAYTHDYSVDYMKEKASREADRDYWKEHIYNDSFTKGEEIGKGSADDKKKHLEEDLNLINNWITWLPKGYNSSEYSNLQRLIPKINHILNVEYHKWIEEETSRKDAQKRESEEWNKKDFQKRMIAFILLLLLPVIIGMMFFIFAQDGAKLIGLVIILAGVFLWYWGSSNYYW